MTIHNYNAADQLLTAYNGDYAEINALGISRARIVTNVVTSETGNLGQFSARMSTDTNRSSSLDFLNTPTSKRVCVGAGAATLGYQAYLTNLVTGNYLDVTLYRDTTFLASATLSASVSETAAVVNLRLDAPVNGSQVDCEIFIDSVSELTYSDTSASRITDGNPGFIVYYIAETLSDYNVDNFNTENLTSGGVSGDSFMLPTYTIRRTKTF